MLNKIEDFFLNKLAGQVIARLSILAATLVSGPLAAYVTAKTGVHLTVSPVEVQMAVGSLLTLAFGKLKAMRMANPNSPAVQTDASKPGSQVSAAELALELQLRGNTNQ